MIYPTEDRETDWFADEHSASGYEGHLGSGDEQVRARATVVHRKKARSSRGANADTQRQLVELRAVVSSLTCVLADVVRRLEARPVANMTLVDEALASLEVSAPPHEEIPISKDIIDMLSLEY